MCHAAPPGDRGIALCRMRPAQASERASISRSVVPRRGCCEQERGSEMRMRGGFGRTCVGLLTVLTWVASVFLACGVSGSANGPADAQSGAGDSNIHGGGGADAPFPVKISVPAPGGWVNF